MNTFKHENNSEPPRSLPVVIAGMHRSGTSLMASILQKAGVDIGQDLLGPSPGNRKGHFEDLDFLYFHQDILISQGISSEGWTTVSEVKVPQQFLERAEALRDERMQRSPLWGWKEPRTTLLLNFWYGLLPQAKFVFVYRDPWEVVDSLFIRGDEAFTSNPSLAIAVWMTYNQAILRFYQSHPQDSVLISFDCLRCRTNDFLNLLKEKLGLNVCSLEDDLFDDALVHAHSLAMHRAALIAQFYPEAMTTLAELDSLADLFVRAQSFEADQISQFYENWALQDWLYSRQLSSKLEKSQSELQQTQTKLQQTQTEFQQTQAELQQTLQQTQAQLHRTQTKLQQTQTEFQQTLQQTQVQLHHTQTELQQTQTELQQTLQQTQVQLHHTQTELQQAQTELQQTQSGAAQVQVELRAAQVQAVQLQEIVGAMEASRFWKLRELWIDAKGLLLRKNSVIRSDRRK